MPACLLAARGDITYIPFMLRAYKSPLSDRGPTQRTQVEASLPASAAGASSGVAAGGAPGGADGWTQLRMAHLIEDTSPSGAVGFGGGAAPAAGPTCAVSAGLYCASPLGPGFEARFAHLTAWAGRIEGPRED